MKKRTRLLKLERVEFRHLFEDVGDGVERTLPELAQKMMQLTGVDRAQAEDAVTRMLAREITRELVRRFREREAA